MRVKCMFVIYIGTQNLLNRFGDNFKLFLDISRKLRKLIEQLSMNIKCFIQSTTDEYCPSRLNQFTKLGHRHRFVNELRYTNTCKLQLYRAIFFYLLLAPVIQR